MTPIAERNYWYLSLILSLTAIAVIGWVWVEAYTHEIPKHNVVKKVRQDGSFLLGKSSLSFEMFNTFGCVPASLDDQTKGDDAAETLVTIEIPANRYVIPTGVFIQSIFFLDANDVRINGHIWQKYPREYLEDFPLDCKDNFPGGCPNDYGVIFPEEIDSSNTQNRLAYVKEFKEHLVIGWYFDVVVRQSFEYSDYPLDSQSVWLRIWPRNIKPIRSTPSDLMSAL